MFSINDITKYRENNRLEAKRAERALPRSIWETYSAFANSLGGIILLGVSENDDKSLSVTGVENADKMLMDFWNCVNNKAIVNANILNNHNVQIIDVSGKRVIRIDVPRAERQDKPVHLGDNPFTGSFRRNGEGDYHCTNAEVKHMIRDSGDTPQDMTLLTQLSPDALDKDTLSRYRMHLSTQTIMNGAVL